VRLLFVNAHFAAHDEKVARRNSDFHRIKSELFTSRAAARPLEDSPGRALRTAALPSASPSPPAFAWARPRACSEAPADDAAASSTSQPRRMLSGGRVAPLPSPVGNGHAPPPQEAAAGRPGGRGHSGIRATGRGGRHRRGWGAAGLCGGGAEDVVAPLPPSGSGRPGLSALAPDGSAPPGTPTRGRGGPDAEPATPSAVPLMLGKVAAAGRKPPLIGGLPPLVREAPAGAPAASAFAAPTAAAAAAAAAAEEEAGPAPAPAAGDDTPRAGAGHLGRTWRGRRSSVVVMDAALSSTPSAGSAAAAAAAVTASARHATVLVGALTQVAALHAQRRRALGPGYRSSGDVTKDHDITFWLGDLNYRVNGGTRAVAAALAAGMTEVMAANDQLRLQQRRRAAFKGFEEGRIAFPPTFKLVPRSAAYSGKRAPSWTDRVLWKVRPSSAAHVEVAQRYYASVPEMDISDHRPVIAGFEVDVSGRPPMNNVDVVPTAAKCRVM